MAGLLTMKLNDLQLLPKSKNMQGILIELKVARNFTGDKLKQLSETALAQIEDCKRY